MNRLLTIVTIIVASLFVFSCSKENYELADNISLKSFTLEPSANEGLTNAVSAVIEDKNIYIRIPNAIDIKSAVPSFTANTNEIVGFVGSKVVESGITPIDLSDTVAFRLSSPNALSQYNIIGLKSASFLSFGFYAADNEGKLFKDYPATISKLDIKVDLPLDADISSLVARYTTSQGATVTFQGNVLVSGTTALDYSQEVQLQLKDAEMQQPEIFKVKVGRLTAPVWSQVALPEFLSVGAVAATVELNPLNNNPYVMIQATGGDRKAIMGYYDAISKSWKSVGAETGFSESRVDAISFTFANNGELYAAYKDYSGGTNDQYGSLLKFSNDQWNYVGNKQGTFNRVNNLSVQVYDNIPYLGYLFARIASPFPNRGTYVESYNNSWTGKTFPQSTTGFYAKLVKGRDGKLYYVTMDLTAGTSVRKPSVYKLNNGNWELVGTVLVGPSNSNSGGINIDLDADEEGNLYLVYQSNSPSYVTYVMKWDGQRWMQLGDGFAQTTSSSANRDNVAIKVHPDGRIFVAYGDANNGVKVTTFNPETGNWNPANQLSTANGNKYEMRISREGIPYLITVIDGRAALFVYDIPNQ